MVWWANALVSTSNQSTAYTPVVAQAFAGRKMKKLFPSAMDGARSQFCGLTSSSDALGENKFFCTDTNSIRNPVGLTLAQEYLAGEVVNNYFESQVLNQSSSSQICVDTLSNRVFCRSTPSSGYASSYVNGRITTTFEQVSPIGVSAQMVQMADAIHYDWGNTWWRFDICGIAASQNYCWIQNTSTATFFHPYEGKTAGVSLQTSLSGFWTTNPFLTHTSFNYPQ